MASDNVSTEMFQVVSMQWKVNKEHYERQEVAEEDIGHLGEFCQGITCPHGLTVISLGTIKGLERLAEQ